MKFEPVAPAALDSSMVQTYVDCPSKFYLEYVLGLKPSEPNPALSYGTIWHGALEILAKENDLEVALAYIDENEHHLPLFDDKNRTAARMQADLLAYAGEYASVDASQKILAIEKGFDLELPSGIRYCGRIDQVREAGPIGLFPLDHKSTTFLDHQYYHRMEMGFQFKGYAWALDQLIPGERVERAMVDVYHILKTKTNFERKSFIYGPRVMADWLNSISRITEQIMEGLTKHLHDPDHWFMNFRSCGDYGGCPFQAVHKMEDVGNARNNTLEMFFEVRRWDPLAHEEKEDAT